MKIVATIEARMASSRLPGKILKPILGKPTLERLVERVKRSKLVQDIVVATTDMVSDDETEAACKRMNVHFYRGSSEDVLDRVLKAAKAFQADTIVELTGDCPLIDPKIIDSVIQHYLDNQYDYVSNVLVRTFPRGMDTQIFSLKVLDEVNKLTQDPADRENVSLYIYEHPEKYKLGNVTASSDILKRPDLRLTVDTQEDFELINEIYTRLYPSKPDFLLSDIIQLIERTPHLKELNKHIQQKTAR